MRHIFTAPLAMMVMVLPLATVANATPFASGKLYGGPNQTSVTCYILNTSAHPVTLSPVRIVSETGTVIPAQTTCGTTLAAHMGCDTSGSAGVITTTGYDCSTDASLVAGLRGSIELRSGSTTLQVQPMR